VSSWHPALASHWYAVAHSHRVRDKPVAVTLLDRHLVLARLRDGNLFALEDRCPHRQAPLSHGCISGSGIRCPYHGWTFGADGRLQELPGLAPGASAPGVRVPPFAVQEIDGLVWLRPGGEGASTPNRLVREIAPGTRRFLWQDRWQANIVDAMENFLDALHTHSVHPGLVRAGDGRCPAQARFESAPGGFRVEYPGQQTRSGWLDRLFESKRTLERVHFAAPGSTQIEYRYANGSVVRISLHFTPRGATLTDVFATLHVEGRWAPAWAVRLFVWPFLRRVGRQDADMLRLQSENMARFPGQRHASTSLDIVRPALERFWTTGELPAPGEARDIQLML